VSSVAANSSLSRQLDDLRQSLKASQDKEILLQADLDKYFEVNTVFQANIAASAITISELESELSSLRSTVAEKLPLADRVLQLEKDANVSMVLLQETKTAHEEALAQISSLVADKAALLQRLELVQTQAEERYNRTFKSKAEYISQVEVAESALEQTRQQLLQLQLTNNDMRSRLEEAKQNESRYTGAVRETARKQV
jgi:chromosome segregation ATPase